MTGTTIEFLPAPVETNSHDVELDTRASRTNVAAPARVPLSMPADQRYFWLHPWQRGERESLADLESGQFRDFTGDDPTDVVRWLLSDDE